MVTLNSTLQIGAGAGSRGSNLRSSAGGHHQHPAGRSGQRPHRCQLPLNARDTYQFLQLQPGVHVAVGSSNCLYGSDNAGAVSVNGGRGRSNNFNVNGGDANDQFANLPTVQPTPDSIEEFRVLTNTFDAEYGRNSGAVVNVVTKSGTNQFHGNVYEFFRNKVLNAKGYLNIGKPDQSSKTSSVAPSADRSRKTGPSSLRRMKAAASGRAFRRPRSLCRPQRNVRARRNRLRISPTPVALVPPLF